MVPFNFNGKSLKILVRFICKFSSLYNVAKEQYPYINSIFIFTQNMQKRRLACELILSLLVMSYGCFSNKIWLCGTNGCSNLILLVWLNIVELKQGNSCILPQFEAIWIIKFSIYILLVDINGIISSGKKETRNTQLKSGNAASCYWMSDKGEAFK